MRFPLSLTWAMSRYLFRQKWLHRSRFPFVLMLEPLHRCNLHCAGCGRIREYASTLSREMTVQQCLDGLDECGAPIVSICGGEPLLYQGLEELIAGILARGKHLYLCTNGFLLKEAIPRLESIQDRRLKKRLFINVHLDGPAEIHDHVTGRPGSFDRALEGIHAAHDAGFLTYTNTTVYRPTTVDSLIQLAEILTHAGINGMMISPGYGYESVETEDVPLFLNREEIYAFFRELRIRMKKYPLTATPLFFDFLTGKASLTCAAWGNPTLNIRGWRGPCYLIGDQHFSSFQELMENIDWNCYGPEKESRCINCLTHCGYEPAAVLQARGLFQLMRLGVWQLFG